MPALSLISLIFKKPLPLNYQMTMAIYYSCGRAPTIVLPVVADALGRAVGATTTGGVFLSHPRPGKHMAFDGRLLHGALHEMAAAPSTPTGDAVPGPTSASAVTGMAQGQQQAEEEEAEEEAGSYVRVSILVNIWVGHRPAGVSPLAPRVASLLSNQRSVLALHEATPTEACSRAGVQNEAQGGKELRVRVLPQESLRKATPNWFRLPLGFPFFHAPVVVSGLPLPGDSAVPQQSSSLVHLPFATVTVQQ